LAVPNNCRINDSRIRPEVQASLPSWTAPEGTLGQLVAEARVRATELASRRGDLERLAADAPAVPSLGAALRGAEVAVVAEVKRRSPSRGAINPGMSAPAQAAAYESGGAAALSILTEPAHFGGADHDLADARRSVSIPLLKKDFHVDPLQLVQAKALGASAALLIVRALSPALLDEMVRTARALALEVLVEVRDEAELQRGLEAGAVLIGVNNRDLETLQIDAATSARLIPRVPADRIAVYESGVSGMEDVRAAARLGADAVLVGSSVSAAPDPGHAVRALTGVTRLPRGH
jgi:indole-3-glycerol phosphate synthase